MEDIEDVFPLYAYTGPDNFCDREDETKELMRAVRMGRHQMIFGRRRLGKTALIHHLFHHLQAEDKTVVTAYIDMLDTTSDGEFITQLITAVLQAVEQQTKSLLKSATKYFAGLKPTVKVDPYTMMPELTLDVAPQDVGVDTLDKLFDYLATLKRKVVIAVDEFQQIVEYEDSTLKATLRSKIQFASNTTFLFSGSVQRVMLTLFTDVKEPFYQSTDLFPIGKIDRTVYASFIARQFSKVGVQSTEPVIAELLDWTQGHTYYTQALCAALLRQPSTEELSLEALNHAKLHLLRVHEHLYQQYQALLSKRQWQLLVAIALHDGVEQITSQAFLRKQNLGAISTVRQSLKALIDKHMVVEIFDDGVTTYDVEDLLLAHWIRYRFG
jgi:AAA+ ATPase superfamily predicted ATPase